MKISLGNFSWVSTQSSYFPQKTLLDPGVVLLSEMSPQLSLGPAAASIEFALFSLLISSSCSPLIELNVIALPCIPASLRGEVGSWVKVSNH